MGDNTEVWGVSPPAGYSDIALQVG